MVKSNTTLSVSMRFIPDLPIYKTEKLYELWFDAPKTTERTNVQWYETSGVTVRSMRDIQVGLEHTGFTYLKHESSCLPLFDIENKEGNAADQIQAYLDETCQLVKSELGADIVFIEDWRHRKNIGQIPIEQAMFSNTSSNRMQTLKPALNAHLDNSADGARRRLARLLTAEEAAKYTSGNYRIRMVNIWRPLVSVVNDSPLALCDIRSMDSRDLLAVDKIHTTHRNEACYLKYNPLQEWYYLPGQSPNEPFMFQVWDSQYPGSCCGAPHVSFDNPMAKEGRPVRESIEVRAVAISVM